ncbi:MAG: VWA domain-containing protein [Candidatus Omnitrophica bacterium]|nr:VWA domain-containing protein [Candidatus Omnitrophota bacterium]
MKFANPHMFYGFFVVFLFAWSLFLLIRYRRQKMRMFLEKQLVGEIARDFSQQLFLWKNIFLVCVLLFSILALARPQWGFEWQDVKRQGVDILLVIDTSRSMLTEDVKPNRLERTKLAVKDLLKKLKGDRVGLIAFSGDAFLTCPLTVDYAGVLLSLEDLKTDTIPRGGTDLGRAIQEALKGYQDVAAQYKAVVILTDGDNLEGDPLHWAKVAAEKKIKISTIGIGTKDGELVRVSNEKGELEFLKDGSGNFVKSRLNEMLLQEIAATTGGAYVRSSGAEFGLDYLYDKQISRMERRDVESKIEKKYFDRFQIPLAIALIFLLAETMLVARKP